MMLLYVLLVALVDPSTTPRPRAMTVSASDGTIVSIYEYAVHPSVPGLTPVLMFHQAGGDARGELGPIAAKLAADGRSVFTADLRSGGTRFGGINATASAFRGPDPTYCDTYRDMVAALDKSVERARGPVVVIGSSYSAALVVKLAAEHPKKVAAFASFSPAGGEPMKGCEPEPYLKRLTVNGIGIRNRASLSIPWVIESNRAWADAGHPVTIVEAEGHGASLLLPDRTKGDIAVAWQALNAVLSSADSRISKAPR